MMSEMDLMQVFVLPVFTLYRLLSPEGLFSPLPSIEEELNKIVDDQ